MLFIPSADYTALVMNLLEFSCEVISIVYERAVMMVRNSLALERRKRVASTGTELLPITLASLLLYLARMMMSPAMLQT